MNGPAGEADEAAAGNQEFIAHVLPTLFPSQWSHMVFLANFSFNYRHIQGDTSTLSNLQAPSKLNMQL